MSQLLQEEIEGLNGLVESLTAQNEEQAQQIAQLQQQLKSRPEGGALECERLRVQNEQLQQHLKETQQRESIFSGQITQLQETITQFKTQNDTFADENGQLQKKLRSSERTVQQQNEELTRLKSGLAEQSKSQNLLLQLQNENDQLKRTSGALRTQIEIYQQKIKQNEQNRLPAEFVMNLIQQVQHQANAFLNGADQRKLEDVIGVVAGVVKGFK